jgi:hypothetical protein
MLASTMHLSTTTPRLPRTQQQAGHQDIIGVMSQDPTTCCYRRSTHEHPRLEKWGVVLLRKEVIQPHLPVRLPCYDFVPIAGPTFDRSLR